MNETLICESWHVRHFWLWLSAISCHSRVSDGNGTQVFRRKTSPMRFGRRRGRGCVSAHIAYASRTPEYLMKPFVKTFDVFIICGGLRVGGFLSSCFDGVSCIAILWKNTVVSTAIRSLWSFFFLLIITRNLGWSPSCNSESFELWSRRRRAIRRRRRAVGTKRAAVGIRKAHRRDGQTRGCGMLNSENSPDGSQQRFCERWG